MEASSTDQSIRSTTGETSAWSSVLIAKVLGRDVDELAVLQVDDVLGAG
jgi:hypothetical protein